MSGFFFFFLKKKQITQSGKEAEASTGGERGKKGRRVRRKGTEGRKEGYKSTDCDGASHKMGRKWGVTEEDGISCF